MEKDFNAIYAQRQESLGRSDYQPEDKEALTRFLNFLEARGVSKRRLVKYAGHFLKLRKLVSKPLTALEGQEIDRLLITINNAPKWSAWTKHDYQLALKKFYGFVDGNQSRAGRIKIATPAAKSFEEQDALSEDDLSKLEEACGNVRERVLPVFLFETGARMGEFLALRVKDAKLEPPFLLFSITGTKNRYATRRVPVNNPAALELFKQYMAVHPHAGNLNASLWVNSLGAPLESRTLDKFLRGLGRRAGLSKKMNPHWFRHSKATQLSRLGVPEAQRKQFFGWSKDSKMLSTYDHTGLTALMGALDKATPESDVEKRERLKAIFYDVLNRDASLMMHFADALAKRDDALKLVSELAPNYPEGQQGARTESSAPWSGQEKTVPAPKAKKKRF